MKTVFVDANVFLRYFTEDDKAQQQCAADLLAKAAAGSVEMVAGPPVLFEIAWTLRSGYGLRKEKVLDVLSMLRALPGLRLTDATIVDDAILLARKSGQEFPDAYIAASFGTAGVSEIATFNRKDFQRLGAKVYDF